MEKVTVALYWAAGCGLFSGFFSLLFSFGDWHRLACVSGMGAFIGLVAAPEFQPRYFKNAPFFQTGSGALAGLMVAIAFQGGVEGCILGLLLGGLFGWSAPFWAKHIQLP